MDCDGKTFIVAFEAKDYPIYGTMFHTEKLAFEWAETNPAGKETKIPHDLKLIEISREYSKFLSFEARKNPNVLVDTYLLAQNF